MDDYSGIARVFDFDGYRVLILDAYYSEPTNIHDDNIDIQIIFDDGKRYSATLFTLKNIAKLMTWNAETGDCALGRYFTCPDMLILRDLSDETILASISHIIENSIEQGYEKVFQRLEDDAQ